MAMSADASCRGLRTSREGPLVLKLSQGEGRPSTPILGSRTDPCYQLLSHLLYISVVLFI